MNETIIPVDKKGKNQIIYGIVSGKGIKETVKESVVTGSLQFYRKGIQPVRKSEVKKVIEKVKK